MTSLPNAMVADTVYLAANDDKEWGWLVLCDVLVA